MNAALANERQRWLVSAAGGGVGLILMIWLFRGPFTSRLPAVMERPKATVVLMKPDAVGAAMQEQTWMHDTTPLFLPVEQDGVFKALLRRDPGKAFLDNDPLKLGAVESGLNLEKDLPPTITLNGKTAVKAEPVDALAAGFPADLTLGFGRVESPVAAFEPRGGFVEVVAMVTGRKVLSWPLPAGVQPPTAKAWQPIEFFAAVDRAGLVGPLVITEGSRVEEVDNYFRDFLAQKFRIGDRLAPGFYRVIVGP